MTNRIPAAFSLLLLALSAHPSMTKAQQKNEAADPIPLAHEGSDIPTDSSVKWGLLDNGMRYAILPNVEPPKRASIRLFVDAGSFMEADDQQGLAHFLEHMAFNGTTHFPAGEMVEYFQRLGMGFGNHTNAHTSFRETVYKLELPNVESAMLEEAFKLLRDYAEGMLLDQEEIDKERGIILSEKRTRDSVRWRTFVEQMKFGFPDHIVSSRMPIGTEEVINEANRDRFARFYQDWYTPNRMAVIVVGDIDVSSVEKMISTQLGAIPFREKTPDPEFGSISKRGFATHYHYEGESGETSVSLESLKPRVNPPDNKARRSEDLRLLLASQIMNRRLERISKDESSPISNGRTHAGDFFDLNFAQYGSIDADCKPEDWKKALALVEQELRRALEHGFTEAELTEAKANYLNRAENAAEQMATRKSRDLADQIASRLGGRRIFTNPKDDLERVSAELKKVTTQQCQELYQKLWDGSHEILALVSGNASLENSDEAIAHIYSESKQVAVTPPEENDVATFAYGNLPTPGKIAESKEIEDLEVTQIRFANNLHANLKVTDFEDETIHVKARIGSGKITEPSDKPGLSFYLGSTFINGGLEAHSNDDLKRLFAGQSVQLGFGVDDDAFIFSGKTNPDDLPQMLTLLRAYITNPGFRPEATTEFRRSLDYIYQQLEQTPGGFAQNHVARFLHAEDPRFGYPDRATSEKFEPEDAQKWIQEQLGSGYFEITVLGDFDQEQITQSLASTLGNLPERAQKKPDHSEERLVSFPKQGTKTFEFESEIQKAMTVVHWPTTDIFDIEKTRRIGMLGAILDDRLRLKIREELANAYSPFAHNLPSDTWKNYGYLFATATVAPDQAEKVAEVVSKIAEELASGTSITEDELERAKKPQITQIEEMRRTNRYWMGSVLESSQEYPQRLKWSRTFVDDYKNITVEDVNELAKEFLLPGKQVTVIVTPNAEKPQAEE